MTLHDQYDQYYRQLVGSLQLLAADADDQLAFLPDFVVATDEVAGDFLDVFHLLWELEEGGVVERSAGDVIRQVKELLDSQRPTIPPGPVEHYAARLRNDDFWVRARAAAKEALLALNEQVVLPELWWEQRKARGQR